MKCVLEESARRYQSDHAFDADDVDSWRRRLFVGFFFRGFALSDEVAKRTGMATIKGLNDCLTEWRALRIVNKHARPGERLERKPV